MERLLRIALVSREVYPFVLGGGLGRYVTATAETLAAVAEVTIFTSDLYEERYHELRAAGSADLPAGLRYVFVPEPREEDVGAFYHHLHCWSARALEALRREYVDQPPDLIEFPDYLGEGCVTVQAKQTLDPLVRRAAVCVRLYTPSELTSVLNGHLPADHGMRNMFELERHALRFCDRIVAPGGDVYETYRRFYGRDRVAPALEVHHPVLADPLPDSADGPVAGGPLRLAYLGRMERRKGVQALVRALTGLAATDWEITLVGGDTDTGPLGVSVRDHLELAIDGDPRIALRERVGREEVVALFQQADLAVFPSRWECWPNVALEALQRDCPVLATPVGGYTGLVEHGATGWLARGTDEHALADALEPHVADPAAARALRQSGACAAAFARLTDREVVRERYVRLIEEERDRFRPRSRPRPAPLVSVVLPYYRMDAYVEETVQSMLAQSHRPIELVLVNDGSLRKADRIVEELAATYPIRVVTQQNTGLGAARNFGISQSRGEYVYPMDPDDIASPAFVERCVEVLEQRPEVAYVTSWSRFVDEDGVEYDDPHRAYFPLGNSVSILDRTNASGSAEAVFRRAVFDAGHWYSTEMTSYEDWLHYRQLAAAGLFGAIVPEPLLRYRVRRDSMVRTIAWSRHWRLLGEMEAHLREAEVTWTPTSE